MESSFSNIAEHIQSVLTTLPELPGVYQLDAADVILYVGKAKNQTQSLVLF